MNREQIRLLNSKTTDLDWYYSKPYQKPKYLIRDLLFTTFVKTPPVQWGAMSGEEAPAQSNASWLMVTWDLPCEQTGGQTHTTDKLPSSNFVGGR